MVMEFLDGEPLSTRIQGKGRLTPRELVPLAKQVLPAWRPRTPPASSTAISSPTTSTSFSEKAGQPDFVKIIDFGISKFQTLAGDGMNMTRTGTVMGTPYYMSPEQANGSREADARSDLYSIGVMLYEAVTGQVPFDAKSFNELLFKIVLSTPPSPLTIVPDLDPAFCSIILKGMARDVEHRFQTAVQFADALDNWARSGLGVTIPPEHRQGGPGGPSHAVPAAPPMPALSASGQNLAAGATALASSAMGVPKQSSQSWATSQHDAPVEIPKSKGGGMAIAAVIGVLVLGGGAFAAFKFMGGPKPDAQTTTALTSPAATPATPAAEPPPAPPAPAPTPAAVATPEKAPDAKPVDTAPSAAAPAKAGAAPVKAAHQGPRSSEARRSGQARWQAGRWHPRLRLLASRVCAWPGAQRASSQPTQYGPSGPCSRFQMGTRSFTRSIIAGTRGKPRRDGERSLRRPPRSRRCRARPRGAERPRVSRRSRLRSRLECDPSRRPPSSRRPRTRAWSPRALR